MPGPIQWIKKGLSEFTDWYARHGFRHLSALHREGTGSWSGEPVTEWTALNHSVVWACKRIISESVAFLPLQLMRDTNQGKFAAKTHPAYLALKNAPSAEMTAMSFREALTGHVVMGGNGYAQIDRRTGTLEAREFWLLQPEQVTPDREKGGSKRLVYVVKDGNSPSKTFTVASGKPQDILHVPGLGYDGVTGYSVITIARQSIGTALATERNAGRFYANGARVPYVLEMATKFKTDEDYKKFRGDWQEAMAEPHRSPILEPGMKYTQTGISMADAQMLESRLFAAPEICRWFLISPHLVGDLSRATFSNIEHLALQFVKMTLTAWLTRWEQNLWRCVLTPEEQASGYYFKHNVNGLLRGDFASRMAGYATALQNGWLSQNEVRDYEDLNSFDGGDDFHIQLNMQSLPGGTPTASQQAALRKIGTAKKEMIQ